MKRHLLFCGIAFATILVMASCGSKKNTVESSVYQTKDVLNALGFEQILLETIHKMFQQSLAGPLAVFVASHAIGDQ